MYNGIGLTTARGSGTNGYVSRNLAFVHTTKDKVKYKTEEEIQRLDSISHKKPNLEILDHERKRKLELKCLELREDLEEQGIDEDIIESKLAEFRASLVQKDAENGKDTTTYETDEYGRIVVRETHQIAAAQEEKNRSLRQAFGISEYFIEGSSLDPNRKIRETAAKQAAEQKTYTIVRTPSPEPQEESQVPEVVSVAPPKSKKSKKSKSKKSKKNKKKVDTESDDEEDQEEPKEKTKSRKSLDSSDTRKSDSKYNDRPVSRTESSKPSRHRHDTPSPPRRRAGEESQNRKRRASSEREEENPSRGRRDEVERKKTREDSQLNADKKDSSNNRRESRYARSSYRSPERSNRNDSRSDRDRRDNYHHSTRREDNNRPDVSKSGHREVERKQDEKENREVQGHTQSKQYVTEDRGRRESERPSDLVANKTVDEPVQLTEKVSNSKAESEPPIVEQKKKEMTTSQQTEKNES